MTLTPVEVLEPPSVPSPPREGEEGEKREIDDDATADGWLSCLGGSLLSGRGLPLHKHRSSAVSRRRCRLALFSLSSLRPTRPPRRFIWSRRFFKKALHPAVAGKAARVRGHRLM